MSASRVEADVGDDAPLSGVTELLLDLQRGDRAALDRLMPLVYDELRRMARRHRFSWGERSPGTTSVVHEAYLKLVDQKRIDAGTRAQFYSLASRVMRSVLIDNARWYQRKKRGGQLQEVHLADEVLVSEQRTDELLAINDALERLERSDERLGRIVECRFYGGLTIDETAETLGLSAASVKRGWSFARAWLYRDLDPTGGSQTLGSV